MLRSLHIILTYKCTYECDHCFVWGSPDQAGVFTLAQLEDVFQQALDTTNITELYFEGGETFIYYPILIKSVKRAHDLGFKTGIVTNGYWATGIGDARAWLQPLAKTGLDKLEISDDIFHGITTADEPHHPGIMAANQLGIRAKILSLNPDTDVMHRGRAATKLIDDLPRHDWQSFTTCPFEDLTDPERIHLDPFGNLHLCQGLVIGNLFERPLRDILADYQPQTHPIAGPLLKGGPTQLIKTYHIDHEDSYVDACHLCYTARTALRDRFPMELAPDQMYGIS